MFHSALENPESRFRPTLVYSTNNESGLVDFGNVFKSNFAPYWTQFLIGYNCIYIVKLFIDFKIRLSRMISNMIEDVDVLAINNEFEAAN